MPARRRFLALGVAALGALAATVSPSASGAEPPGGAEWTSVYFPSRDGTSLHGDLLLPEQGCPEAGCPVIVSIGPYFGHSTQGFPVPSPTYAGPSDRFYDFIDHEFGDKGTIFDQGYAWLQVDSRGYGVSGGCSDYGGPGEQMDVAAAVEWAGTQPWSNGKVGMWGKSYDAWTQVMGLAMNPPHLEAVVIQAPLIEGYGIGYVNGVHHSATWYATTSLYMLYDYTPNALDQTDPQALVNTTTGMADPCWAEQQAIIAAGWDHDLEYWRQRDLRPSASHNDDVAVLWAHGFNDVNTKPDQIFGVYDGLTARNGDKTRAWFGQWAHDRGNEAFKTGRTGFLEEALDWFDHYLKGEPFEYGVNEKNVVEVQDSEGGWRTEAVYPPSDVQRVALPIRDGSYVDNGLTTNGPGYWTVTQPLEHAQRISGEAVVNVTADIAGPFADFVGVLYDVDPASGRAIEIARTAYRFEGDGPVSFRMHPADYVVPAGHRIAFHVTNAHPEFMPHSTGTTVGITGGSVEVPFLTYQRRLNLEGEPAAARPYSVAAPAAALEAGSVQAPLPPAPLVPDAATAERLQPTVTAPGGSPADE